MQNSETKHSEHNGHAELTKHERHADHTAFTKHTELIKQTGQLLWSLSRMILEM